MNVRLKTLKGVFILAISISLVYGIERLITKQNLFMQNQIVHFVSEDNSFSFDYPLFDNWSITTDSNSITYTQKLESRQITIREKLMKVTPEFWPSQPINPQGVPYFTEKNTAGGEIINFRISNGAIEISIPKKVANSEFSGQKIRDIILNSFESEKN